ncbi:MAG: DUF1641 domain-containing protein [Oscillochloridaceae bacterium umkhey_bin13]
MSTNGATAHPRASVEALLDRLSEPRTAEALHNLLDHAELLAYSAGALDGFIRRGELIADNVAASLDDVRQAIPPGSEAYLHDLAALGHELPALTATATQLARLSAQPEFQATLTALRDPETLQALNLLLSKLGLLSFGVSAAESLLQRGEELTDNLRSSLDDVRTSVPEANNEVIGQVLSLTVLLPYLPRLVAVAPQFIAIIERLAPFVASSEFDALLSSGVFQPATVKLVGQAGDAFVASYAESRQTQQRFGLRELVGALRDPDVQRAAALIVTFARRFGHSLER